MQWIRRVLRGLLMVILLLACAFLFYVLVIMGDTGSQDAFTNEIPITQPPQASVRLQKGTTVCVPFLRDNILCMNEGPYRDFCERG